MSMRRAFVRLFCLTALFVLATTIFTSGQGIVAGSISGTLQDAQKAVITKAEITAINQATNQKVTGATNSIGYFRLSSVPIGTYTVNIEAPSFAKMGVTNVVVNAGQDTSLGTQALTAGATKEVVTVEGTTPMVENQTAQISTTFDTKKITDLPIPGNGFDRLALFSPGVVSTQQAGFSNNNGVGLSVNGQRGRSNNFQLDGQSNNDNSVAGPSLFLSNQDLISEVHVITNNFDAQYGRNMGSVVNYLTKSGTNSWHGTAFEYYTGSVTDSLRNQDKSPVFGFCMPGQTPATTNPPCKPVVKPRYVENRYGGTLGGPIVRDKAWFFGSYLADPVGSTGSSTSSAITPTPAGLAMLQSTYCAGDPACQSHPALGALLTNGPFANPIGTPTPSLATQQNIAVTDGVTPLTIPFSTLTRRPPTPSTDYEVSGRGDWQITPKDLFFARYIYQNTFSRAATGRIAAGAFVDEPGTTHQIGLDYTRTWTPNFVNQMRASYARSFFGFAGEQGGKFATCQVATITSCPVGIQFRLGLPVTQIVNGVPVTTVLGVLPFGYQNNLPQDRLVNNTQYQDNASWVHGRHTVKFGGEYDRQRSPNNFLPNINGTYLFNTFNTMLSNTIRQLTLSQGPLKFNFKEQDVAFYFQDDWRIKDNLTLNLGIRWEWDQQAINLLNNLTVARETGTTPFWNNTLPLAQRTVAHIPEDLNNWAPNFGFAWTPRVWQGLFGHDSTVFRGGYRIAYDPSFYNMFLNVATAAPTVNTAAIVAAGANVPKGTAYNGVETQAARLSFMPLGLDPGFRSQTTVAPNFHNPYAQQWSFGMERTVSHNLAFELGYVGTHTVGNFQTVNANPRIDFLAANFPTLLPPGVVPCPTATAAGFNRVDCSHGLVRQRGNTAFSKYHALQSRLDLRDFHGLSMRLNYTYSRTIDNASEIFSTTGGGVGIAGAQNFFNINRPERGVSATSYPHVFSMYYIYELPMYKSQQGWVGHALGGWEISSTYRFNSGQPYNPIQPTSSDACDQTFNNTFFGADTCRPILGSSSAPINSVGQCTSATAANCGLVDFYSGLAVTPSQVHWIINDNTSALFFGSPFRGVGRNIQRGQTVNNVDFALFKNTKLGERVTLQFEASAFNLFNRQFRDTPDPVITDGQFNGLNAGSFQNTFFNNSNRRRMTLGMKLIF